MGDLNLPVPGGSITYSFIPDGTSIGGVPSRLDQSLMENGFSTPNWQQQFRQATAIWTAATGIQFIQVPDNGAPLGSPSPRSGDAGFGDIRIGGIGLAGSELALAFLPSPLDGGVLSGDIVFNVNQPFTDIERTFAFQPNTATGDPTAQGSVFGGRFDFMTVALHEIGHTLGIGDTEDPGAVLADDYNGAHRLLEVSDLAIVLRSQATPNSGPAEAATPIGSWDVHLTPGGSATLGVQVLTQGFYILRTRTQGGGVTITGTGPDGPVSLPPGGATLMYLMPGDYGFQLNAVGPGADVRLEFSAPAVDPQSILANGVGQGPALSLELATLTGADPASSLATSSLPLITATTSGTTLVMPPPPIVALVPTASLTLTIGGTLVGLPSSAAVGAGTAYPDRPIGKSVNESMSIPLANGSMSGVATDRTDEAMLSEVEWLDKDLFAFGGPHTIPDSEGPSPSVAALELPGDDQVEVAGLAVPPIVLVGFTALFIRSRDRLAARLGRRRSLPKC